jgi:hypothetical protein
MNLLWIGVGSLGLLVSWLLRATMADLLREEARTRVVSIPFAILRLAMARVPHAMRDDLAAEWNAELHYILRGSEGLPITRLIRGIRYAVGLLRAARAVAAGLTGRRRRFGRREGVPMPVTIGDVWEAIENCGFRPEKYQAGMGHAYLEGPDGRWVELPNKSFMDWGLASEELLAILAAWGVQPVASGNYALPARVRPGFGGHTCGVQFHPRSRDGG